MRISVTAAAQESAESIRAAEYLTVHALAESQDVNIFSCSDDVGLIQQLRHLLYSPVFCYLVHDCMLVVAYGYALRESVAK